MLQVDQSQLLQAKDLKHKSKTMRDKFKPQYHNNKDY